MRKKKKIIFVIIFILGAFIFLIPILFEDKIVTALKNSVNDNINANFDFKEVDLSVWRKFPDFSVAIKQISVVNKAPFEGDTLFTAKKVALKMSLLSIFSTIKINSFVLEEADIRVKINKDGVANYDIAQSVEEKEVTEETDSEAKEREIRIGIQSYQIKNSTVRFEDASSKMKVAIQQLNHKGSGDFSSESSTLKTETQANIGFKLGKVNYLNSQKINWDAAIKMDLKEQKYTFLENELKLNQLPLQFDGYVQMLAEEQKVEMTFKTPSSDFKNILALIPETYSKDIQGVTTTGNFDVTGFVKGVIDKNHIPKFSLNLNSKNASFKYPDLPKSLQNINVHTKIVNDTGLLQDTYVDVQKFSFVIDEDTFSGKARLQEVTENMKVDATVKGKINLGKLQQLYPAEALKGLKGILQADAKTRFAKNDIEKKRYQRTKTTGQIKLSDFEYASEELKKPLKIHKSEVMFTPKKVKLRGFEASLGDTDILATGTIDNLLGFMFNDENIEGRFKVASNKIVLNDFMVTEENNVEEKKEDTTNKKPTQEVSQIKIPSFLACTIEAQAKEVLYDDIHLKEVSGILMVKDEKAELKNMKTKVFGGAMHFDGGVSTKSSLSTFNMKLNMNQFNIEESFQTMSLLKAIAPIAKVVQGKLNSEIHIKGQLNNDLTPNLATLSGNILARLMSAKINSNKSPLISRLQEEFKFLDLKKLDLNNIETAIQFKEGKIGISPFNLKYEDIDIQIGGSHSLNNKMDYKVVLQVPAKYLGEKLGANVAQWSKQELKNIKVPVEANLGGNFKNPKINVDWKTGIKSIKSQIINNEKNKLIEKGSEEAKKLLSKVLGGNSKKKDNKKNTDIIQNTAKNILGGLLGNKKKKDTVK